MAEYRVSKIAGILGKSRITDDVFIRNILTDSRKIYSPADSVFFAIQGERHNGHDFIPDLYEKGIRSFVISEKRDFLTKYPDANFIFTGNALDSLQKLAAWHRSSFPGKIIGITGSNGKTIVKEWLYHCLSGTYNIARNPKSYNSQLGVPLSVWLLNPDNNLGIFEAGISMPGEMINLEKIIVPGIGIFTNIGEAHQENFKDIAQKIREKLKLFMNSRILIYCKDNSLLENEIKAFAHDGKIKLFSWSLKENADMQVGAVSKNSGITEVEIKSDKIVKKIKIPFTDDASLENAFHVIACLIVLDKLNEETISRLHSLPAVAMRLELKKGINNCTLINDSYNSDINSLVIALDMLNMQSQHKVKTIILSDLYQTGVKDEILYSKISQLVEEKKINRFIGIGENLTINKSYFKSTSRFFNTTNDFLLHLPEFEFKNEAILVKGSRRFEFERITDLFEEKKHLTRLEINLNGLIENLNYYRSFLKKNTKVMVMVKALSYGTGSYEIANILQFQRVDYLGVAIADEGADLRNAGIHIPVMVMNPDPVSYEKMITYSLEPEIYNFTTLQSFDRTASRYQELDYPVHIKIDTGMHRLGFVPGEINEVCEFLKKTGNIRVRSVFSHLAASDEEVHDSFTREQISIFEKACIKIENSIGYPFIRHILNSSGIERFPESQFEMVRLGIGLYGYSPTNQGKLKNVGTLKSTISQIKKVDPGDTIGYGRKGQTGNGKIIGIIPIGYADGLNRRLSNGVGKFLVHKKSSPIIGNICMDMCMIDLTGIKASEGDEVIIFGEGNPVSGIAAALNTIPYEVISGISARVKRIFYHE